jgi:hypothetical protein
MEQKIKVTFPNDYYPIEVPIKSFLDFQVQTDLGSTVFGWVGDETGKLYVSMEKPEWMKLCEFRENNC